MIKKELNNVRMSFSTGNEERGDAILLPRSAEVNKAHILVVPISIWMHTVFQQLFYFVVVSTEGCINQYLAVCNG